MMINNLKFNISFALKLAFGLFFPSRHKVGFVTASTYFSVLGMALGVGSLIIVISVMDGFKNEIINKIVNINGDISIYLPQKLSKNDFHKFETKLTSLPLKAYPQITAQAIGVSDSKAFGVNIRSFAKDNMPAFVKLLLGDKQGILLGRDLAANHQITPGQDIYLISPNFSVTVAGIFPKYRTYKVSGIVSSGLVIYDSSLIIMPYKQAQTFLFEDTPNSIEVFLDDHSSLDKIQKDIQKIAPNGSIITNWRSSNRILVSTLNTQRNVMAIILFLIILVAAFNVISTQVMSVSEKIKEISILRAIGMSKFQISTVFLLSGMIIGLLGAFMGLLLGIVLSINLARIISLIEKMFHVSLFSSKVYLLSSIAVTLDPKQIAFIFICTVIICVLASIYPAYRAANVEIAKVLQYE